MTDDLDRLVDAIESEGPSPEFVATLRARIVAETEGRGVSSALADDLADGQPDGEPDLVDLRPVAARPTTTRRWMPIGMVAAAVALIVGLIVVSRPDDDLEPVDQPSVTTPVPTTIASRPATFAADATRFTANEDLLDPGTYRVDAVGTPFSLTIDSPLRASIDRATLFLAHPDAQGRDDRSITFMRLTALSDPARPIVAPGDASTTWPADDLDGWLAAVSDEVVVSNRVETTLAGVAATRVDLELGETDCIVGENSCGTFGTNRSVRYQELLPGSRYRIWLVDQGEHAPLAVVVAIDRESDRDWFDAAEAILSTVAFGEVGANPILAGEAGSSELPVLGGVRIDLPDGSYAMLDTAGVAHVLLDEWPGGTAFVTDPRDAAGEVLASSDDVVAALRAGGANLTELEPASIGGVDARVFDHEAAAPAPSLRPAGSDDGWSVPRRGRLWLVEHPEHGMLVIAAGASENLDIVSPLAVDQATVLVESLEFSDPG